MHKSQAQIFLDRLFQAFGQPGCLDVGGTPEFRIHKADEDGGGTAFADYVWKPVVLMEMKKRGTDCLADCFRKLVKRGVPQPMAQHFILQMLVALFAEDIDLLPKYFVTQILEDCSAPASSYDLIGDLFEAMNTNPPKTGGRFKGVSYFNGGLFARPAQTLVQSRAVFSAKKDLLAQLLALNQAVAAKIENGETVTAPGVPKYYPDAKKLVTEDCICP